MSRSAGDPIARVVKSHAWYWKPRTVKRSINGGKSTWWLGVYIEYFPKKRT